MAVHVKFDFLGETQIDRTLVGFAERARNMTGAWEQIRESFRAIEADRFESEGDGEWEPLSPSYAAWKAKHYPGAKLLVATGEMKASALAPDIDIIEPSYAVFGTANPKARLHQDGAGRLPKRKVIDMTETQRAEWIKIVQSHLVNSDHDL